jgi:hypothetical protein
LVATVSGTQGYFILALRVKASESHERLFANPHPSTTGQFMNARLFLASISSLGLLAAIALAETHGPRA